MPPVMREQEPNPPERWVAAWPGDQLVVEAEDGSERMYLVDSEGGLVERSPEWVRARLASPDPAPESSA